MNLTLAGRVILITGAASGVGAAVARAIAAAGADVMLTDRDAPGMAKVAEGLSGEVGQVAADLADIRSPGQIMSAMFDRFGRIDGLVNAAGLTTRSAITDGTPGLWDLLFAVNARAPFFLMQAAVNDMLARQAPGSIVNILSVNAHCGRPDLAIYSATKGALATLTRNAANAHLADRIRVNGINLGWTLTEAEDHMQAVTLLQGADWAERAGARLPLGRLLSADEVASQVLFLLSDLSAPLTGALVELEQRVLGAP